MWCVDTSAWIDAVRFYNPASPLFKDVWEYLEAEAMAGRVISPKAVYEELKDKKTVKDNPAFGDFIDRVKDRMFVEESEAIQERCTEIVGTYPKLTDKGKPFAKSDGDAWVIAVAQETGAAVVANESPKPSAPVPWKIPDVAGAEGIDCMQLPEFLDALQGLDGAEEEEGPEAAAPLPEPDEGS